MTDTITLMRQRVLDMAIRGELVEQREEEDVEELIVLINADKKRLIDENKIKKIPMLPEIDTDEIPFSLPINWKWVRLGNISNNFDSKRKPVSLKDRVNQEKIYPYYGATGQIDEVENYLFDGMYLLIGEDGGNFFTNKDNSFIVKDKFWANNHVHVLQLQNTVTTKYMMHFINALDLPEIGLINGIAVPKLNQTNLNNILVPLPPLEEQKRIVAKIEEIFSVIDQIGERKAEALTIINNIRQTALQDAIMGALVEQNETDESASILYDKIQAEKEQLVKEKKIKKEATLPDIGADEIPFDIPESWKWVRLGDIVSIKGGKRVPKGEKFSDVPTDYAYLRVSDMHNGTIIGDSLQYLTEEIYEKIKAYTITSADVYLTIAGTIGRVGLIPEEFSGMNLTENACKLTPVKVDKHYLMYGLYSNFVQNQFKEGVNQLAQPKLSIRTTRSTIFPLPPIAEQRRIVEKLDEIIAICDQMEAILDVTSEENEALKVAE